MKIDLFYKSYHKDFKLLQYSLLSLAKNITGYNSIVILIPENEKDLFDISNLPERTVIHYVPEYGNGYLLQQVYKIKAHNYCSADFILFADSDCIFDHPINLQEVFKNNKPEILYTDYSKVGEAICWKKPTEEIIGRPVEYEFMRRNCLIFHRETIVEINEQYPNIEQYIMASGRFSEFNFLGCWAFINENKKYSFVNTDLWEYTHPHSIQLWSWADINGDELNKKEYQRTIDTINKVFGTNITKL